MIQVGIPDLGSEVANLFKREVSDDPAEWEYSSFMKYVREGLYSMDWGAGGKVWPGMEGME